MNARSVPAPAQPENIAAPAPAPAPASTRSSEGRADAVLFRIIGEHQHQAVVDGHTLCCTRQTTVTNDQLSIRWSAFKDGALLTSECRTLNAAKNICRNAVREDRQCAEKVPVALPPEPRAPRPRRG